MVEEFDDNPYIPDEEEQNEINEILNREEEITCRKKIEEKPNERVKNRIYHLFNSEDHWIGWLRTNGIRWI